MRKYTKADQKLLATWALDCARRVLPLFEKVYPEDNRLRRAIDAGRTWVRTGVFKMAVIRSASLGSHAAARHAKANDAAAACFAARAVGQAVGTAHVTQHAFGGAIYALKAIVAAHPAKAETKVAREWNWQSRRLPQKLRQRVMKRIVIEKRPKGIFIKLEKGKDF